MAYVWAASSGTCSLVVCCCWLTEGGWRLAVPTDGCLLADAPKMRFREMQVAEDRRRGFGLDSEFRVNGFAKLLFSGGRVVFCCCPSTARTIQKNDGLFRFSGALGDLKIHSQLRGV